MNLHALLLIVSGTLCILLGQCRHDEKLQPPDQQMTYHRQDYQQNMMGTRFIITIYTDDEKSANLAAIEAFQLAAKVNDACSDYDTTSELMRLNAAPAHQAIPVSPLLYDVLDQALTIAKQTAGAYDPTLGHHSYNWRMARKKGTLPSSEKIARAKAASGWNNLQLDKASQSVSKNLHHMRLDLGGIAKGYAADLMHRHLQQKGFHHTSVTAGGEVRLGDPPPETDGWKVRLKTLDSNHQLSPHTISLKNCAISTSGDLHQSIAIDGQRYSHICDPNTGLGLTHRISATVISDNSTVADALATALCVDPDLKLPGVTSLIIHENDNGSLQSKTSKLWKTNNLK